MQHFAEDDYSIEKAIARYEGLPFLPKVADSGLQVGRADLDPYTPEDQHFRPAPEPREMLPAPAAAPPPPPGDPNCPYCHGQGCEYCSPDFQNPNCPYCNNLGCEHCSPEQLQVPQSNNTFESKKKCQCWDGYKRVPGTKPCAPGSCEKCDGHSKKEAAIKNSNFINEIVGLYAQYPEFAQTVARSLFQVLRAAGQAAGQAAKGGFDVGIISQIQNYIKPVFDKWSKGEIGLEDVDQIILGINFFGQEDPTLLGGSGQTQITAKIASQGDKPSPKAAQAVFAALASGDEAAAKDLLKQTDCPEGCETHPEGKCNHGYMSAGRTRVRYLINDSSFDKPDEKEFGTTDHESQKEAGFLHDMMQVVPDAIHAAPHIWNEINPAGSGFVGNALNELNPGGDGLVGQGVGAVGDAINYITDATNDPSFNLNVAELNNWHNAHNGPEHAREWADKVNGFVTYWESKGVKDAAHYLR